MKNRTIILLAGIFFLAFLIAGWVHAQEDEIMLEHKEVFEKSQRSPVKFSHATHSEELECTECHHIYEYSGGERENVWAGEEQKCSDCHKLMTEDKKLDLRTAFHENCMGCHRKMTKEGGKTGPVTCGECHILEKDKKIQ